MKLFDLLKWFAQPVVRLALALLGPLGIILGAILNPAGAVNSFICRIIDIVASVWPSTPNNLKIANLVFVQADVSVGRYIISEIFSTLLILWGIVMLVKVYKLIPFKAT